MFNQRKSVNSIIESFTSLVHNLNTEAELLQADAFTAESKAQEQLSIASDARFLQARAEKIAEKIDGLIA